MGKNKVKLTGFRISDNSILQKLKIIAAIHCRNRNQEVEYILKNYVESYEKENGTIQLAELEEEPEKKTKL